MRFFAKWIAVDGVINHDDMYISSKDGNYYKMHRAFKTNPEDKLAKLYICSDKVAVGDKVYNPTTKVIETVVSFNPEVTCPSYDITTLEDVDRCGSVKLIGIVSPEALTFVKEGNLYNEDELLPYILEGDLKGTTGWNDVKALTGLMGKNTGIQVKGPCGHFH